MSRYIGKRVSYECGWCKKQFTLNKQSVDDSEKSGDVFCSKRCSEQFYLSDVIKSVCGDCLYYLTCNHESRDKQICDNYDNEP